MYYTNKKQTITERRQAIDQNVKDCIVGMMEAVKIRDRKSLISNYNTAKGYLDDYALIIVSDTEARQAVEEYFSKCLDQINKVSL